MHTGKGRFRARILDSVSMERTLSRMAHQILERGPGVEELVLIGIRTRGAPLAQRIAAIIRGIEGKAPETGCLNIGLYRGQTETEPKESLPSDLSMKTVILVDDVLQTGKTLRAALDALTHRGTPRCIQAAVLIDRGHRELPIHADYVGKNVPTAVNEYVQVMLKETDSEDQVIITEVE